MHTCTQNHIFSPPLSLSKHHACVSVRHLVQRSNTSNTKLVSNTKTVVVSGYPFRHPLSVPTYTERLEMNSLLALSSVRDGEGVWPRSSTCWRGRVGHRLVGTGLVVVHALLVSGSMLCLHLIGTLLSTNVFYRH
jgi:hypothetical protein